MYSYFRVIYFFLRFSSSLSIAYRNIVRGILLACLSRNAHNLFSSFFPASRSIQPTALCIRSCLSLSNFSESSNVGSSQLSRMNHQVATMLIRRSQRREELASFRSSSGVSQRPSASLHPLCSAFVSTSADRQGSKLFSFLFSFFPRIASSHFPRILYALASTRSQLFTYSVFSKYMSTISLACCR